MQQTSAHEAMLANTLTPSAEEALTLTQGHSREVVEDYYIRRNMTQAVTTACAAHQQLHGDFTVPNIPRNEDEEYIPQAGKRRYSLFYSQQSIDNECEEDERPKKRSRKEWSEEEEKWLVNWISTYTQTPSYEMNNRVNWKRARIDLLNDDQAKLIFASEHIDATKMRECSKRIAKRVGIAVHELQMNHL